MTLLELLVLELPNRGGWPDGKTHAWQDHNMEVRFSPNIDSDFFPKNEVLCELHRETGVLNVTPDHEISVTREQYEAALAASKPEWDGEGLPPVGCEFEYQRCNFGADEGTWVKCTMKYAGDKVCVVHLDGEGESWLKHEGTKFRPIRSEADKKRDEIIEALKEGLGHAHGLYDLMQIYHLLINGKIPHIRID